jgi:hypothetical protein
VLEVEPAPVLAAVLDDEAAQEPVGGRWESANRASSRSSAGFWGASRNVSDTGVPV